MHNEKDIRKDKFVAELLTKIPTKIGDTFSDDQLLGLKIALSARAWGAHALDLRGSIGFWRFKYYYVVLAGREKRKLSARLVKAIHFSEAIFIVGVLTVSMLLGLVMLYLVKSAMGINLIEGWHFGLWDWLHDK